MVSKENSLPLVLAVLVLLAAVGLFGRFFWQQSQNRTGTTAPAAQEDPAPAPVVPTLPPAELEPVEREAEAPAEATVEEAEQETATPNVAIEADASQTVFTIQVDGQDEATLSTNGESEAMVLATTANEAFIAVSPLGLGGYILYDGWHELYWFDLATGVIEKIPLDGVVAGISPDSTTIGIVRRNTATEPVTVEIVIHQLADQAETHYPVNSQFTQAGDIHFSPFGQQVAFAAAVGDPADEAGQVVVIDLVSGEQTTLDQVTDGYFVIHGWKDAETLDYQKQ